MFLMESLLILQLTKHTQFRIDIYYTKICWSRNIMLIYS